MVNKFNHAWFYILSTCGDTFDSRMERVSLHDTVRSPLRKCITLPRRILRFFLVLLKITFHEHEHYEGYED